MLERRTRFAALSRRGLLIALTHPSPPLQVSMVNLETCKEISPISTFVPKEGEVRLSFSYTPPLWRIRAWQLRNGSSFR